MGSKVFVLLGLSLAVFLIIASEVSARELAETTTLSDPTKAEKGAIGIIDGRSGYNNHGDGYGHGGGGSHYGGGGGHGGGGGCKYGCCGHGYHGCKCCSYEGEAVDATKP